MQSIIAADRLNNDAIEDVEIQVIEGKEVAPRASAGQVDGQAEIGMDGNSREAQRNIHQAKMADHLPAGIQFKAVDGQQRGRSVVIDVERSRGIYSEDHVERDHGARLDTTFSVNGAAEGVQAEIRAPGQSMEQMHGESRPQGRIVF